MPAVKNVGEPCAGEPHARFDAAAGGNQASRQARAVPAPPADPTATQRVWVAVASASQQQPVFAPFTRSETYTHSCPGDSGRPAHTGRLNDHL